MSNSTLPTFWFATLGLLMGSLFLVSAGSFVAAMRHPATIVDAQYYSHGLSYGSEGREAPWRLEATATREKVEVRVADAAGAPVTGGTLICLLAEADSSALPFTEARPGIYTAPRTLLPKGDLHTTVRFSKGSSHSTRKMVIFQ